MSDIANFHIRRGDRLPPIQALLNDATGAAISLGGATVAFVMEDRYGTVKAQGAATILDANLALVEYAWGATDTDTPGLYAARWVVTLGGKQMSVPNDGDLLVEVYDND